MSFIQNLSITAFPWFEKYKEICTKSDDLQKLWIPAVGDWLERHYRMDMSPIPASAFNNESRELEIINYKSTIESWYHVTSANGESRLWKSQEELLKGTSKWVPRLDQLLYDHHQFLAGSIEQIHMNALDNYIKNAPALLKMRALQTPA